MLRDAWYYACLQRMDHKKFPKQPEQIWDKHHPDQSVDAMWAMATRMASNGKEVISKTRH